MGLTKAEAQPRNSSNGNGATQPQGLARFTTTQGASFAQIRQGRLSGKLSVTRLGLALDQEREAEAQTRSGGWIKNVWAAVKKPITGRHYE